MFEAKFIASIVCGHDHHGFITTNRELINHIQLGTLVDKDPNHRVALAFIAGYKVSDQMPVLTVTVRYWSDPYNPSWTPEKVEGFGVFIVSKVIREPIITKYNPGITIRDIQTVGTIVEYGYPTNI